MEDRITFDHTKEAVMRFLFRQPIGISWLLLSSTALLCSRQSPSLVQAWVVSRSIARTATTSSSSSSWTSVARAPLPQPPSSSCRRATLEDSATTTSSMHPVGGDAKVSVVVDVDNDVDYSDQPMIVGRVQLNPSYAAALRLARAKLQQSIPEQYHETMLPLLQHFVDEYLAANQQAAEAQPDDVKLLPQAAAQRILGAIQYGIQYGTGPNKFKFDVTHTALRGQDPNAENGNTIDFYAFGCNLFRPAMNLAESVILGKDVIDKIMQQVKAGENVVLFANHQSEADPQVVSCCLEMLGYGEEAANFVYVAGHKVTTDPLAIPFSMGRNLICIHSKKHIDADPATKSIKQKQNLRAMGGLLDRLKRGGCVLWVAPSGGRDRRNVETGQVPLAPFDMKTIDMFRLMGSKSKVPTHFYTLAMVTYDLCPPPDYLEAAVGEQRNVRFVPVGIAFGPELNNDGGLEIRHEFSDAAMHQCEEDYDKILQLIQPEMPDKVKTE